MILKFPRVKMFYLQKGQEVEVVKGQIIDAQDGKDQVEILMRTELRERRFSKYHRVAIDIVDFNEIAFACNYFATDLATKVANVGKQPT